MRRIAALCLLVGSVGCVEQPSENAGGEAFFIAGGPIARAGQPLPQPQRPTQPGIEMPAAPAASDLPSQAAPGEDYSTHAADPESTPVQPEAGGASPPPVATEPAATPDPSTPDVVEEPAAEPPMSTGPGMLTVRFTSVSPGGRYAPRNIGAIWIETGSGQFVKTLKRWAGIRANDLRAWPAASGGWSSFFGIGATADELDAVTAATLRNHEAHEVMWDMMDNDGQVVPDGTYRVQIEVAESASSSSSAAVEFDKGATPVDLAPSDQGPYSGLTISYQP
ncbi:MAG: DUF2271 domain-containing protein [Myxococcales bacterium]|nr:DUF2271 domain-containing protein [Myxococcales bacterium]